MVVAPVVKNWTWYSKILTLAPVVTVLQSSRTTAV